MQIIPLGFWGVPEAGETTSFLVSTQDNLLLIDTGANPMHQLSKTDYDVEDIDVVFLSHCHADHLQGITGLVFGRMIAKRRSDDSSPLTVLGNKSVIESAQSLLSIYYPNREFNVDWQALGMEEQYQLSNGYELKTIDVDHTVKTQGLILSERGGQTFGFTADTKYFPELKNKFSNCSVLLGECFGTSSDYNSDLLEKTKHLSADDIGRLASQIQPSKLILFHMQPPYQKESKQSELISAISELYLGDIIFPAELESIEIK